MSAVPVEGPPSVAAEPPSSVDDLGSGWDLWLLGATAALMIYGLVMVLSASGHLGLSGYDSVWHFGMRQIMGLGMGLAAGFGVLVTPWPLFRRYARWVYGITLLLVFLVQSPLGVSVNGAKRWIDLGPLNLQPSELAKVGLALVLADHLARNEGRLQDIVVLGTTFLAFVLPMLIGVELQSDLGTIALLIGIAGVSFFVAGLEWKWVVAAVGVVALAVVGLIVAEPYRMKRVTSFLDPLKDAQDEGYQVVQGWVALAVGGVFGQGLGQGVAQQGFLPEAHTDMISAVVVEELGIFGWAAIFFLHGIVLWRGVRIATEARSMFEMILASSLTAVLAAQVIVNTGVVGGLVPSKGLVLPFMSYGASAAITHTVMVAFLLRVGLETRRASRTAPAGVVAARREA